MRTVRFSLVLAVVATVFGSIGPAHAAAITVNTLDDELNSDGDCSLREAIRSANSDGVDAHDACEDGSGNDTINVPGGTITLSEGAAGDDAAVSGDLDITSDVTIDGAGARSTFIDGADLDRVFHILSGTVTFSELTIRNGTSPNGIGSGIMNDGTLTLTRVAVSDNVGDNDGAGVYNQGGTLTVRESLIRDNVSGIAGGGISSQGGSVTIENSTVSGNVADCMGGGISLFNAAMLEMNNVTIADNEADSPPGTEFDCSDPSILNGGGIFVDGTSTATLSNTLIGDNRDQSTGTDPDHHDCSGTLQSTGYNLIEDTTGCTITGTTTGNITGQDPQIQALADEGGPTDTHQIKNNSPAVDTGNPATSNGTGSNCEPVDQRGFDRPRGARCDIGAFERGAGEQPKCFNKKVTLEGTEGSDTLTGTSKRDVMSALGGDDVVVGGGGNDLICAGSGNDTVKSQAGADQVNGAEGNDKERGGGGSDTLLGKAGRDKLLGQAKPDTLRGGSGKDTLKGGGADDTCKGGGGKDVIKKC